MGCCSSPHPEAEAIPAGEITHTVNEALRAAEESGVKGKDLTPFLLGHLHHRTGGRSLAANIALLLNNATVAGRVAVALG